MNSLILAWFCGLLASWMTFAAIPEARTFLNMPAMVLLLGSVGPDRARGTPPPTHLPAAALRAGPCTLCTGTPLKGKLFGNALTCAFVTGFPDPSAASAQLSPACRGPHRPPSGTPVLALNRALGPT